MGQKSIPTGLRLGVTCTWSSRWFADKKLYKQQLLEDFSIKKFMKKEFFSAGIAEIQIERPSGKIRITIKCSRPGVLIGKGGKDIEQAKRRIVDISAGKKEVELNIVEVKKPELDAKLVAEKIASQLENRVGFRRAMRGAVTTSRRMGAEGVKVTCSGRLGGAEIARTEWYREGRVPLHTLRADISYGTAEAHTTYGIIGVKVWIFKGEIKGKDPYAQDIKDSRKRS